MVDWIVNFDPLGDDMIPINLVEMVRVSGFGKQKLRSVSYSVDWTSGLLRVNGVSDEDLRC